jgi:hypothetical protein
VLRVVFPLQRVVIRLQLVSRQVLPDIKQFLDQRGLVVAFRESLPAGALDSAEDFTINTLW